MDSLIHLLTLLPPRLASILAELLLLWGVLTMVFNDLWRLIPEERRRGWEETMPRLCAFARVMRKAGLDRRPAMSEALRVLTGRALPGASGALPEPVKAQVPPSSEVPPAGGGQPS